MPTTTANQQLPLPTSTDNPNVPSDMNALALAIEKKLVMVFSSATDRSTRVPSPTVGMFAAMTDSATVVFYDGSAWKQVYPPTTPAVTNGTTVPSNSSGANGDVFFKF